MSSRHINRYILLFALSVFFICNTRAQCGIDYTFQIPDNQASDFYIVVEDLNNPDLSSPAQGLCAVLIEFEHEHVADLVIELTSPSGQVITLIGPPSPQTSTQFASWDISFTPCSSVAAPDPGFSAQWSSSQNWAAFGDYTGTYYPFLGCLEDYDTGSAVGTWTLFIRDNQQFDVGLVHNIELVFCNPAGAVCGDTCVAEPHSFTTTEISVCDTFSTLDLTQYHQWQNGSSPDDSTIFFLTQEDTIFQSTDQIIFNGNQPNQFNVVALGGDRDSLPDYPAGGYLFDFLDSVGYDGTCFNLSGNVLTINYLPGIEYTFIDTVMCFGDSIFIDTAWYSSNAIVQETFTSSRGCDSIVEFQLQFINLETIFDTLTIGCGRDDFTLVYNDWLVIQYSNIIWQAIGGMGGIIQGYSDSVKLRVPGLYEYDIITPRCSFSDTLKLVGTMEPSPPMVNADTITCANPVAEAVVSTFLDVEKAIYYTTTWDSLAADTFRSSVSDSFIVVLMYELDCRDTALFFIPIDTTSPFIPFSDTTLNCLGDTYNLVMDNEIWSTGSYWVSGNDTSTDNSVTVEAPSMVYLHAMNKLGCIAEKTINIAFQNNLPILNASVEDIDCTTSIGSITAISNQDLNYTYTFQGAPISNDSVISVTDTGSYLLEAVDQLGCISDTTLYINYVPDTFYQSIILMLDTVICPVDSAGLTVMNAGNYSSILWQSDSISVYGDTSYFSEEDLYYVYASDDRGCMIIDSYYLIASELHTFQLDFREVICEGDSVILELLPHNSTTSTTWTHPDNTMEQMEPFTIPAEGQYRLQMIDIYDCEVDVIVPVDIDTVSLLQSFSMDTSGICEQQTYTFYNETPTGFNIQLNLMDSVVFSGGSSLAGLQDGVYTLHVTDSSGACEFKDSFRVENYTPVEVSTYYDYNPCLMPYLAEIGATAYGGVGELEFYLLDSPVNFPVTVYRPGLHAGYVEDSLGCTFPFEIDLPLIEVIPPDIGPDHSIVAGENILFHAGELSADSVLVNWYNNLGVLLGEGESLSFTPSENTTVIAEAVYGENCTFYDTAFVEVLVYNLFIPNAFTPNGDGVNDIFQIYPEILHSYVKSFVVFDRWGNTVIKSDIPKWDGWYKGEEAPPGVYLYTLEFSDDAPLTRRQGEIHLIR